MVYRKERWEIMTPYAKLRSENRDNKWVDLAARIYLNKPHRIVIPIIEEIIEKKVSSEEEFWAILDKYKEAE